MILFTFYHLLLRTNNPKPSWLQATELDHLPRLESGVGGVCPHLGQLGWGRVCLPPGSGGWCCCWLQRWGDWACASRLVWGHSHRGCRRGPDAQALLSANILWADARPAALLPWPWAGPPRGMDADLCPCSPLPAGGALWCSCPSSVKNFAIEI